MYAIIGAVMASIVTPNPEQVVFATEDRTEGVYRNTEFRTVYKHGKGDDLDLHDALIDTDEFYQTHECFTSEQQDYNCRRFCRGF